MTRFSCDCEILIFEHCSGSSATHATVYAQLFTPDGVCHGLHGFYTPLRDPNTMLAYPGVVLGDMGEKLGLNGVDNGFAIFNNYRIPKDSLLDKNGKVSSSGKYISCIKDPRKRFGKDLIFTMLLFLRFSFIINHIFGRIYIYIW